VGESVSDAACGEHQLDGGVTLAVRKAKAKAKKVKVMSKQQTLEYELNGVLSKMDNMWSSFNQLCAKVTRLEVELLALRKND